MFYLFPVAYRDFLLKVVFIGFSMRHTFRVWRVLFLGL